MIEKYEKHWYQEDNMKPARGVFGWPLVAGCVSTFWIVVGVSWLLDNVF